MRMRNLRGEWNFHLQKINQTRSCHRFIFFGQKIIQKLVGLGVERWNDCLLSLIRMRGGGGVWGVIWLVVAMLAWLCCIRTSDLYFNISYPVSAQHCNMEDWSVKFSKQGFSSCGSPDGYYFLSGFERSEIDSLQGLKKAKCCRRSQTFWNLPTQCQMPNWIDTMGRQVIPLQFSYQRYKWSRELGL